MKGLILFQSPERRHFFFQNSAPVETLLSVLKDLLNENQTIIYELGADEDFSENTKRVIFLIFINYYCLKGKICCDILISISSILSRRFLDQFPDLNQTTLNCRNASVNNSIQESFAEEKPVESICLLKNHDYEEKLEFFNTRNLNKEPIILVPKDLLCENSEYFKVIYKKKAYYYF